MKLISWLSLVLLGCNFCIGQPIYFSKTYDIEGHLEWAISIAELPGQGYLMAGTHANFTARTIWLLKVDEYGDTIWTKIYGDAPILYSALKHIVLPDGSFVVVANVKDTTGAKISGGLFKFTSEGDSVWFRRYGGVDSDFINDVIQTEDGGFILVGYTWSKGAGLRDIWIVRTDSLGNEMWDKTFGGSDLDVAYRVAYTPSDSGFIIGGNAESFASGIYILKLDKLGTKMWDKILDVNIPQQGGGVVVTDGGYLVYGSKDRLDGNGQYGYFAKLDLSGDNVLWERTYGSVNLDMINQAIELDDGSYVGVGSIAISGESDLGWIIKINQNGDSLWARTHSVTDAIVSFFYDVKSTQDKGFVACGFADDPTQDVWLVKLDSLGCLIEGCAVGYDEATQAQFQVSVIPNPFHGRTIVQIPQQTDEINFEVYDVFGRNVRSSKVTSTFTFYQEDLPAGLYLYRLHNGGKILATGKLIID